MSPTGVTQEKPDWGQAVGIVGASRVSASAVATFAPSVINQWYWSSETLSGKADGFYVNSSDWPINGIYAKIGWLNGGVTYHSVNDLVVDPGDWGTYSISYTAPPGESAGMLYIMGNTGLSTSKRLTVSSVTTSAVGGVGRVNGTVTNSLPEPIDVSSIYVTGYFYVPGGTTVHSAFIDGGLAWSTGRLLASGESTTFQAVSNRADVPVALDMDNIKAEARYSSRVKIYPKTKTPSVLSDVTVNGVLEGARPWGYSFLGGQYIVALGTTNGGATWYLVDIMFQNPMGVYTMDARFDKKTYVDFYYAGNVDYSWSDDVYVTFYPKAWVGTPSTPSTAYRNRTFATTGFLKPKHTAGAYTAKLYFYRLENKKWVLRKTVSAKNSNYSTYTKYSASVKLGLAGKWRVRAFHPKDAEHEANYSSYRYFTVR